MISMENKINEAITLEREIKVKKQKLDEIKAGLQSEIYAEMLNRNLKWKQEGADKGLCNVSLKNKLEVDNFTLLQNLLGGVVDNKVDKKISIEYEVQKEFKEALIALYQRDYAPGDIPSVLQNLGLGEKQIKVAIKKLSGDYVKDLKVLNSLGVTGSLEEELDLIHGQKNYELVSRFFDLDAVDDEFMKQLKLALSVEESLSIGFIALEA